jgi:hypothetical protein
MATAMERLDAFKQVIGTQSLPALGPQGRPGTLGEMELENKMKGYFAEAALPLRVHPLLRSAALLWHDHLDASHRISQDLEMPDGSWLHGIMHRREPDYGNAKYWFRRVGRHEAFPTLAEKVAALLPPSVSPDGLIQNGEWMPFAFVDACARAAEGRDAAFTTRLQSIQAAEFDTLALHILSNA